MLLASGGKGIKIFEIVLDICSVFDYLISTLERELDQWA
jgi:hypothetical protein